MQHIDAIAKLASFRYSPDTAASILADAMLTGVTVRRGVRVTFDDRHGYRVARADRSEATRGARNSRTRRGAARARARARG